MIDFYALLQIILTLMLLLIVGVLCRKTKVIGDHIASKNLSTLIIKVGQPLMIVAALAKQEYNEENLHLALIATLIGIVMHIVMAGLAFLLCLPIKDKTLRNVSEFTCIFANCGFLGFPIMEALFGDRGLFMAAFYVIGFNLMIWSWGLFVIGRGTDTVKVTVKKIFVNYGTIPCAIGFLVFLSHLLFGQYEIPAFLMNFMNYLGNLCTPISVLITGALLATIPVSKLVKTRQAYYTSLVKLIIMPLIICFAGHLMRLPDMIVLFCTAMAALPSAATVTMFCEMYDIEGGAYASQMVGTTSVLCLGTLPVIMLLADLIIQI